MSFDYHPEAWERPRRVVGIRQQIDVKADAKGKQLSLFAKVRYVGREGRHYVLKLSIPQRHREWFEGLWNRVKGFLISNNRQPGSCW